MIVNGVTLPDISAEVLKQYPYAVIVEMDYDSYKSYNLCVSTDVFFCLNESLANDLVGVDYALVISNGNGYGDTGEGDGYYYIGGSSTSNDEWIFINTGKGTTSPVNSGLNSNANHPTALIWANHDVYEITSIDTSTGEFVTGEIYFPNSEAEEEPEETKPPRYSIATAILDAVARQIMRLTDSTQKVKPEEFEVKMEGINIQLQELTVTATEEKQTITPPSGFYGFSKVIVEAVEDSGSSGGGGTPGEGGDDSCETYVSSDNVTFGVEYVESEVPTGMSDYYLSDGTLQFTLPDLVGGPYAVIAVPSSYCIYTASSPLVNNSSGSLICRNSDGTTAMLDVYVRQSVDGVQSWKYNGTSTSAPVRNTYWTNHAIKYEGYEKVWMEAGTVKQQTTTATVAVPLDRPDTYTISGDNLNSIVSLTQTITGSTENMTPSDAIAALEEYAEKLETGEV